VKDIVDYLNEELETRKAKNPQYSLRSFAASLEVNAGTLTKILKRKLPLSTSKIYEYAKKLELPDELTNKFVLIQRVRSAGRLSQDEKKQYHSVEAKDELYQLLEDWKTLTIYSLLKDGFSLQEVQDKTFLNKSVIDEQIELLNRYQLIEIHENKIIINEEGWEYFIFKNAQKQTLKNYQQQIIDQSSKALSKLETDKRTHSATMFQMNQENLEKAKTLIRNFTKEMHVLIGEGKDTRDTELYHMQISLFPAFYQTND
jgi:uncharacterized protein (TIGR02147 family)